MYLSQFRVFRRKLIFLGGGGLINFILIELNDRLSFENMQMLNGISALCPDSDKFLQSEVLKPFALQMKADLSSLFNEIQALKSMLKDTK